MTTPISDEPISLELLEPHGMKRVRPANDGYLGASQKTAGVYQRNPLERPETILVEDSMIDVEGLLGCGGEMPSLDRLNKLSALWPRDIQPLHGEGPPELFREAEVTDATLIDMDSRTISSE